VISHIELQHYGLAYDGCHCHTILCFLFFIFILFYLPQNTSNTKKQGNHTKANKSGEEAQKETMGLIDIGLP